MASKAQMNKQEQKPSQAPSKGTVLGEKARQMAQGRSDEERAKSIDEALAIIYGGSKPAVVNSR